MGEVLFGGGGMKSSGMLVKFSCDDACSSYSDCSSAHDRRCSMGIRVLYVGMEDCSLLGESVVRGKRFRVEVLTLDRREFGRFGIVSGGRCGSRLLQCLKLLGELVRRRLQVQLSGGVAQN